MTKKIVGAVVTGLLFSTTALAAAPATQTVQYNIDSTLSINVVNATETLINGSGSDAVGLTQLEVTANGEYHVTVKGENGGKLTESTAADVYVPEGLQMASPLKVQAVLPTGTTAAWVGLPVDTMTTVTDSPQQIFQGSNASTTEAAPIEVSLTQPVASTDRRLEGGKAYRMKLTYTVVAGL